MVTKLTPVMTAFPGQLVPIGTVVPYLGSTPPSTAVSAASTVFEFGDDEFDDVNNGTLELISTDGTSRTYTIRNDAGASTNLEFNAGASADVAAANLKIAIEHADGHDGKITVNQTGAQLQLVQVTQGSGGNTVITVGASFENTCDVVPAARFTGGVSKGWLYCDGAEISRTTFAALFTEIGTTHGVGDGSTTFNLPDLRGRFLLGRDDMGSDAAAGRTGSTFEGVDGETLGATGGKVTVVDASKSHGMVCNWIIRASEDDD